MQPTMQYSPYPSSTNPWGINTNYDTPMVAIPNTAVIQTYNPFAIATPIDTSGMEIRLRELYRLLERAKKKYHKYVSVAATTPTYVWIPVAGTISAGVVAGVYGDRANKKKKQIERLQAEIANLQYQIGYYKNQNQQIAA